jgi:hypothetical protein
MIAMSQLEPLSTSEIVLAEPPEMIGASLQAEEFERVEDKYLVPVAYRDELLELLYRKSRPCYLTDDTQFLGIESVYYESPTFQSFRDHFMSKPYRFKLRTRRYEPNGIRSGSETHIELKSKDGETSRKFRFRLGESDLQRLHDLMPVRLSSALLEMNGSIPGEELSRRARHISRLVEEHQLKPLCRVHYERRAFERKGIRVTVDMNIESQLLRKVTSDDVFARDAAVLQNARNMSNKFLAAEHVLLEIKHRGMIPKWLEQFTLARTAGKTGFSKYCFSITQQTLHKN